MKTPFYAVLVLSILAGCSTPPSTPGASPSTVPPNIILILTDDHGWSQLSRTMDPRTPEAHSKYLETPHMVRLMREGMRFTSGYSPAPLCTPTRRSILCGTTTARCGSEFKSAWVPAKHPTIPKVLKAARPDYRTAHFGKWGELMISTPEQCGYDASDGMTGNNTGGMPKSLGVKGGHADGPPHFVDNDDPKRTRTVTDGAVTFLTDAHRDKKPFYVQVSYYAVHLSVVAMEKTIAKYRAKGEPDRGYTQAWAAMMEEMDDGVGRILGALDRLGIGETTYVFFTADNGGRGTVPGGKSSRRATNFPLTGAKHSLQEGGIRVPFIARGPGVAPGSVCNVPVAGYDFLPTFYDLAGGQKPLPDDIDGSSLRPLLENPKTTEFRRKHGALFFHRPRNLSSAIRQGEKKLMIKWNPDGTVASRTLYRFDPDPREEGRDILEKDPETAKALEAKLLAHLKSVGAETPADMPKRRRPKRQPKKKE